MGSYPRPVRDAAIKCIPCNAPVVRTVDDDFVCVECGVRPVMPFSREERRRGDATVPRTADD